MRILLCSWVGRIVLLPVGRVLGGEEAARDLRDQVAPEERGVNRTLHAHAPLEVHLLHKETTGVSLLPNHLNLTKYSPNLHPYEVCVALLSSDSTKLFLICRWRLLEKESRKNLSTNYRPISFITLNLKILKTCIEAIFHWTFCRFFLTVLFIYSVLCMLCTAVSSYFRVQQLIAYFSWVF